MRFAISLISMTTTVLLLSGCSKFALGNGSLEYQNARALAPLQLPANAQSAAPFSPLYPVPEVQSNSTAPNLTNPNKNRYVMPAPTPLDTARLNARKTVDIGKPSPPVLIMDGNGFPLLRIEGSTDRVWKSLNSAADAAKLNITERRADFSRIDLQLNKKPFSLRIGQLGNSTTVTVQDGKDALAEPTLATDLLQQIIAHWPS